MQRFVVSPHDRQALERLRAETGRADVLRNALIVLLSADGRSKAELSRDLGCSTATIDRARRRYRERGVDGLLPVKPPGRPSRATPEFRAAMAEAVRTPPQVLGYGFSTWSVARLAAHLKKATRVGFSDDQLRRLLHQEGFSVQRPKHTMKGRRDEARYERARGELEALKKGPSGPTPPRP
jgi:putative transposase